MICIPVDIDSCPEEHAGHYCAAPVNHLGCHWCEHGHAWPRGSDVELEKAMAAYVAHFTVYGRNGEVNQRPPHRVVVAACQPADSHWRHVVRAIESLGM